MMQKQDNNREAQVMGVVAKKITSKFTLLPVIWLAIILACCFALEALFFCCTAFLFPYATRIDLGFGIYPLLQTSKNSVAPQRYTAIFGDSYAFGSGDWFLQVQHQRKPIFNTAHLLHQKTREDFISFGIPGSSNLCGWIEDPAAALTYINRMTRYSLPEPEKILLFFYEGNDIGDNLTDLQGRYLNTGYDFSKIQDSNYFSLFIEKEMLSGNRYIKESEKNSLTEKLYLYRLTKILIEKLTGDNSIQESINAAIADAYANPTPRTAGNFAKISGKVIALPDNLGAPPVEMESQDINNTFTFINSIANYVRNRYPAASISIVYIPSPAISYDITADDIHIQGFSADTRHNTREIQQKSDILCQRIQQIAVNNKIGFIDTRPGIRIAGKNNMLHGDIDYSHFNQQGYSALADILAESLKSQSSTSKYSGCFKL